MATKVSVPQYGVSKETYIKGTSARPMRGFGPTGIQDIARGVGQFSAIVGDKRKREEAEIKIAQVAEKKSELMRELRDRKLVNYQLSSGASIASTADEGRWVESNKDTFAASLDEDMDPGLRAVMMTMYANTTSGHLDNYAKYENVQEGIYKDEQKTNVANTIVGEASMTHIGDTAELFKLIGSAVGALSSDPVLAEATAKDTYYTAVQTWSEQDPEATAQWQKDNRGDIISTLGIDAYDEGNVRIKSGTKTARDEEKLAKFKTKEAREEYNTGILQQGWQRYYDGTLDHFFISHTDMDPPERAIMEGLLARQTAADTAAKKFTTEDTNWPAYFMLRKAVSEAQLGNRSELVVLSNIMKRDGVDITSQQAQTLINQLTTKKTNTNSVRQTYAILDQMRVGQFYNPHSLEENTISAVNLLNEYTEKLSHADNAREADEITLEFLEKRIYPMEYHKRFMRRDTSQTGAVRRPWFSEGIRNERKRIEELQPSYTPQRELAADWTAREDIMMEIMSQRELYHAKYKPMFEAGVPIDQIFSEWRIDKAERNK